ncbi:molybdopterin dinucleotide binding domain-containing protein [Microbacterium sp. E-13]|uniref:molybdopterin dinucleotide binding domain-containing protein n=1 Tax=Microbacterium sp. E-13 TaxID=3404048 RepID=UPI003CECFB2E
MHSAGCLSSRFGDDAARSRLSAGGGERPWWTGSPVYHFHTRTKTGRAPQLRRAAPSAWVELSRADAAALGIREGDIVRVTSARGEIVVPARVGDVRLLAVVQQSESQTKVQKDWLLTRLKQAAPQALLVAS